jgi:hypothetical protein
MTSWGSLKYVIHRLMHAFFHIRIVFIPWPISTSGRYRSLGMTTVLIWKRICINTVLSTSLFFLSFYSSFQQYCQLYIGGSLYCSTYRLMHIRFHIKTVVIIFYSYMSWYIIGCLKITKSVCLIMILTVEIAFVLKYKI